MTYPTLEDIKSRCVMDGDCWLWRGAMTSDGRPLWHFKAARHSYPVRRLVYELHHGRPVPSKRYACANCESVGCVSPLHVKAWNRKQQNARTSAQGGFTRPEARINRIKGARSGRQAKINMEIAEKIRAMRAEGKTYRAIGEAFGVHLSLAHKVCVKESWAPLPSASVFNFRP